MDATTYPTADHKAQAKRLTSKAIRQRQRELLAMERDLIERLIVAENAATGLTPPTFSENDLRIRQGAERLLDGAARLPPPRPADGTVEIRGQLEMVRLAHKTLLQADVEAVAAETLEWVLEHEGAWKRLVGAWFAAAVAFEKAQKACQAFVEAAPSDAGAALPLSGWCAVGFAIRGPGGHDVTDVIAAAKAQGVSV